MGHVIVNIICKMFIIYKVENVININVENERADPSGTPDVMYDQPL